MDRSWNYKQFKYLKMQSFEFLGRISTGKKGRKSQQIIQENLQQIKKYLDQADISSLKLTCRPFYYYFVTAELWVGLKINVAQEKLQYFDDFDFEEAEAKQITKKDKNIRIHSLKKQNQERMKKLPIREPSNIKQKGKAINQNNELLFRNTEIGFKRLLKTNSKKKISDIDYEMKQVGELPRIDKLQDYIIKISDPWSTNMSKAQNLINLFKKINDFHHKFLAELKLPSKDMNSLSAKIKRSEEKGKKYIEITSLQPYKTIIVSTEGSKQNLLIDDQLNKVCRLFWNFHSPMQKIVPHMRLLMELMEKQQTKLNEACANVTRFSVQFVETLSSIDQSIEVCSNFLQNNIEAGQLLSPQIISIYFSIVQHLQEQLISFQDTGQQTRIDIISWGILSRKPFFWETLFQILASLTTKLIKLAGILCPDDLTLSITINKIRNTKLVAQSLLNIAKYFGKIKKQIEDKQKKGKESKTPDSIRQFLLAYENKEDQNLYLIKNTAKLEKIIAEFKEKISALKTKIQSN